MIRFRLGMILFFLGLSAHAVCAETAETPKISDTAELSYVDTGGNSELRSLMVNNLLKYPVSDRAGIDWKLHALYGETAGVKSAERYLTELRGTYQVTDRMYSLVMGSWTRDTFAGFDARYFLGAGLGYKIITTMPHLLQAEAGLNYTIEERTDGTSKTYPGGRLFAQYEYHFNDKNKFIQSVEYLPDFEDSENYNINSETALISAISTFLSMKGSYVIRYDHEPAAGTKETDTILGITLVMNLI